MCLYSGIGVGVYTPQFVSCMGLGCAYRGTLIRTLRRCAVRRVICTHQQVTQHVLRVFRVNFCCSLGGKGRCIPCRSSAGTPSKLGESRSPRDTCVSVCVSGDSRSSLSLSLSVCRDTQWTQQCRYHLISPRRMRKLCTKAHTSGGTCAVWSSNELYIIVSQSYTFVSSSTLATHLLNKHEK
jgi:hypothetical protein